MIKQVLMVDDDPVGLFLLTRCLAQLGPEFQLAGCNSGQEALALSQTRSFDLVITDYMMPGLNGLQLAHLLKERQPDLKIILATGFIEEVPADQLAALSLIGFIPKPFSSYLVGKVVHAVLAH